MPKMPKIQNNLTTRTCPCLQINNWNVLQVYAYYNGQWNNGLQSPVVESPNPTATAIHLSWSVTGSSIQPVVAYYRNNLVWVRAFQLS